MKRLTAIFILAALAGLLGCERSEIRFARVDDQRLRNAEAEAGQWLSYGRTYDEQRFSPLQQITKDTIDRLGLAWFADFDTNRSQEATPLVIDGVIYVSTAWSKVNAYDARSGRLLWHYDPKVPGEWGVNVCCDVVNRGLAAWGGKIYVGTLDGRLIALDAGTGAEVWSTQTTDTKQPYSITGAPRVVKDKVLIGQAGAEYGVRGYVSAYDAGSGEMVWRFYTVPGNPAAGFENDALQRAAQTWTGEWWLHGGGGTVWDAIVYDQVLDQVYVGVGNGSPWNASLRSPGGGDNLYLSSIVALDADTGKYIWHYQTTPWESWDYTATQPIMIAELPIAGEPRRVVMQAPKNGFFYVLDAKTGKLLSAEAFTTVTWATGVDLDSGRPNVAPEARYHVTGNGKIVAPSAGGGHSWHPWSYNPGTGLVYIPAMRTTFGFVSDLDMPLDSRGYSNGVNFDKGFQLTGKPGQMAPLSEGFLLAWDPLAQKEVWSVSFGDGGRGGGTLSTAGGLVFQGNSAHKEFAAYDAASGEKLWSLPVHTGIVAGPVSYEVDGQQFIAVTAGNNSAGDYYASNHSRLLVFRLGGTAVLPPAREFTRRELSPPEATAPPELVQAGADTYSRFCNLCHGDDGINRGTFPDLLRTPLLHSQEGFDAVVLNGVLKNNGMASFAKDLDANDTFAIRAYLIDRANRALTEGRAPAPTADNDREGADAKP